MNFSRRGLLATIATLFPALALASKSTIAQAATAPGVMPATGTWATLEHVTDGTDPSTTVVAPPQFTADIRSLVGKPVTLKGYVQPVSGGFGKSKDYLLSRATFHCPYCYTGGRGSLALATVAGHVQATQDPVTITGTLALQESDPSDFYFQIKDAKIV